MCISHYMQTTFFYLGRFLKKIADDQSFSISKGSIYHIKHVHTAFYYGKGLAQNWAFNGSTYRVWYVHILYFDYVWQNAVDPYQVDDRLADRWMHFLLSEILLLQRLLVRLQLQKKEEREPIQSNIAGFSVIV